MAIDMLVTANKYSAYPKDREETDQEQQENNMIWKATPAAASDKYAFYGLELKMSDMEVDFVTADDFWD